MSEPDEQVHRQSDSVAANHGRIRYNESINAAGAEESGGTSLKDVLQDADLMICLNAYMALGDESVVSSYRGLQDCQEELLDALLAWRRLILGQLHQQHFTADVDSQLTAVKELFQKYHILCGDLCAASQTPQNSIGIPIKSSRANINSELSFYNRAEQALKDGVAIVSQQVKRHIRSEPNVSTNDAETVRLRKHLQVIYDIAPVVLAKHMAETIARSREAPGRPPSTQLKPLLDVVSAVEQSIRSLRQSRYW